MEKNCIKDLCKKSFENNYVELDHLCFYKTLQTEVLLYHQQSSSQ